MAPISFYSQIKNSIIWEGSKLIELSTYYILLEIKTIHSIQAVSPKFRPDENSKILALLLLQLLPENSFDLYRYL